MADHVAVPGDMEPEELQAQFLNRLHELSAGDPSVQVSMFNIGDELGWDRDATSRAAEELIGAGLVEVRTLSGGIAITEAGVGEAAGSQSADSGGGAILNKDPILNPDVLPTLEGLLAEVERGLGGWKADAGLESELAADLRTLEAQLTSPKPKTGIIRETLSSMNAAMAGTAPGDLHRRITRFLGDTD